jgi:hypothetical protein
MWVATVKGRGCVRLEAGRLRVSMSPEPGHNRRHVNKTKQKATVILIPHTL